MSCDIKIHIFEGISEEDLYDFICEDNPLIDPARTEMVRKREADLRKNYEIDGKMDWSRYNEWEAKDLQSKVRDKTPQYCIAEDSVPGMDDIFGYAIIELTPDIVTQIKKSYADYYNCHEWKHHRDFLDFLELHKGKFAFMCSW